MKPLGYLVNYPDNQEGERGVFYDYILSANGLFIESKGKLLSARIPVDEFTVRGLAPLEPQVNLYHGRIPHQLFDLSVNNFLLDTYHERYLAVAWKNGYSLYAPEQTDKEGSVEYMMGDSIILDLHSHAHMPAFFSTKDNEDETGLKLYGVVGKLDGVPVVKLRIGVYGYFYPIAWNDVFDGSLTGAVESAEIEEVIQRYDL